MTTIKDLDFYIALVHYPIKSKTGETISTAVTNLDVHDIARLSATFGMKNYYITTPIKEQQALVGRIVEHWTEGYGFKRNHNRTDAIKNIKILDTLYDAVDDIRKATGKNVKIITTSARSVKTPISFAEFAKTVDKNCAYLIVFGTGWGLADEIINESDVLLEPIRYDTGYNHLSVRSAVSIILDRLYNALFYC